MLQLLIWAGLSGLITVGVGAAIVVVNRRREREALELAILEDVADRVDALDGVEDRLARLSDLRPDEPVQRYERGRPGELTQSRPLLHPAHGGGQRGRSRGQAQRQREQRGRCLLYTSPSPRDRTNLVCRLLLEKKKIATSSKSFPPS